MFPVKYYICAKYMLFLYVLSFAHSGGAWGNIMIAHRRLV